MQFQSCILDMNSNILSLELSNDPTARRKAALQNVKIVPQGENVCIRRVFYITAIKIQAFSPPTLHKTRVFLSIETLAGANADVNSLEVHAGK